MNALFPAYDACAETLLHCRCTVCSGWWHLENANTDRAYWCPHCGLRLDPPDYPDEPKNSAPQPPTPPQELAL